MSPDLERGRPTCGNTPLKHGDGYGVQSYIGFGTFVKIQVSKIGLKPPQVIQNHACHIPVVGPTTEGHEFCMIVYEVGSFQTDVGDRSFGKK